MKKKCKVDGCDREAVSLGMCQMHYLRFKSGNPDMRPGPLPHRGAFGRKWKPDDPRYKNKGRLCDVPGCNNSFYARGLCRSHYDFLKRYGFLACRYKPFEKCAVNGCEEPVKSKGFCTLHYARFRNGKSLYRPKGKSGPLNIHWKGGVSQYPNHSLMKKNRKEVLEKANYKCFFCGEQTNQIHHKDHSKTNHDKANLVACCHRCNLKLSGPKKTSKFIRWYGKTAERLASELNMSVAQVRALHATDRLSARLYENDVNKVLW